MSAVTLTHAEEERLRKRAKDLGLYGLLAEWERFRSEPWLEELIHLEEEERGRRSLARRLKCARLGRFKPMADFDWSWPKKVDREHIEEVFTLRFLARGAVVVLVGPNGVGKTMIAQNVGYQAVLQGSTVLMVSASVVLGELAAQETASTLQRRLAKYVRPRLLCIDELGYLSYDNRHADLLFELVSRRYADGDKSLVITTNRSFKEWDQTFPNASCVVTLVDRLVHRSEIIELEGESYRLREAKERQVNEAKKRAQQRRTKRAKASEKGSKQRS